MASTSERSWKVRRLIAMSPAEVGLRIVRGVRNSVRKPGGPRSQTEYASPSAVVPGVDDADGLARRVERELNDGVGSLLPGARDRDALVAALAADGVSVEAVVSSAEAVLAGTVRAFGGTAIDTGESPDWLRDPVSGNSWPLRYWAELDFRDRGELGDPRYVWEVNRHHHLVTLARAWSLSGDERFAERVWRDVVSWVRANPPLFGINWASPLEIAIRLMSWAMALDLVGARGARGDAAAVLATSVSLQVRHLSDNLSVYASSRNNHLIGEAVGLLVAGAKFPFVGGSERFSALGLRVFEREFEAQVTADGVTREQAFQYQSFVMEFALLAAAAAACLGTQLAQRSVDKLRTMSRFLQDVSGTTGVPPSVGDDDGGRAYELSDVPGRQAARAAVCGTLLAAQKPRAPRKAGDLEAALWLLGPRVVSERVGESEDRTLGPASSCYAEGGYFVAAGGGQHGVIDCGPLGYLSIAAHGHADCLSLSVSHGGRWVLVDPGTYCYHRDGLWRDHFRSTVAHNTVSVDGRSQSEMLGPFMWGNRACALQRVWATTPEFDLFEGEQDGYRRSVGVTHRRQVVLGRCGYWLVVDRLEGSGTHSALSTFQLAPGFERRECAYPSFESGDGTVVDFRTWLPYGVDARVAEGEEHPPRGWVSRSFGVKEPAPALLLEGPVELPAELVTVVMPRNGELEIEVVRSDAGESARGAALEFRHPEGTDRVLFGEPGTLPEDEVFKGVLGFVAARADGERAWGYGIEEWSLGGSRVRHEPVTNLLDV